MRRFLFDFLRLDFFPPRDCTRPFTKALPVSFNAKPVLFAAILTPACLQFVVTFSGFTLSAQTYFAFPEEHVGAQPCCLQTFPLQHQFSPLKTSGLHWFVTFSDVTLSAQRYFTFPREHVGAQPCSLQTF